MNYIIYAYTHTQYQHIVSVLMVDRKLLCQKRWKLAYRIAFLACCAVFQNQCTIHFVLRIWLFFPIGKWVQHRRFSASMDSASMESTKQTENTQRQNYICTEHGQIFFLLIIPWAVHYSRYFHIVYIVLGILYNLEIIWNIWRESRWGQKCKNGILYKELECPHISLTILSDSWSTYPVDIQRCLNNNSHHKIIIIQGS